MRDIQKIVVPVDFGKNTDKLIEYAIYIANRLSATIHFVHVVYIYPGDAMLGNVYARDIVDKILDSANFKMSEIIEETGKVLTGCSGVVLDGDPVDEIVKTAKAKDSDMIIISTHGTKGLEKIMLGSVAGRVLKRAHCPVLIMNPFKKQ